MVSRYQLSYGSQSANNCCVRVGISVSGQELAEVVAAEHVWRLLTRASSIHTDDDDDEED